MTYKLIQECGLHVFQAFRNNDSQSSGKINCVYAADLEAFLAKGVRVYEQYDKDQENIWSDEKSDKDTHQALLINIREIPKLEPVSKEELVAELKERFYINQYPEIANLINRIEKAGIR